MITDYKGTRHEVSIEKTHHNGYNGSGELKALCVCGWRDWENFAPQGERFAVLKLQYRASDHVPVREGK